MAAPEEPRWQEPEAAELPPPPDPAQPPPGTSSAEEDEPGADTDELLGGLRQPPGFWTFQYYQSFFDVDTHQVLERIRGSVTPLPGKNFVHHHLRDNPDLYGPFWICATLVLALTVSGNLSHLAAPGYRHGPQFHSVTVAAVLVYGYAGLVPLVLWGGFLRGRPPRPTYSCLQTLCAYGYSLCAYIPATVLWLVPAAWLQWLALAVAALLSAAVLAIAAWPLARARGRATALAAVATVTSLHTLLAVGCKLYFFRQPPAPGLLPTTAGGPPPPLLHPNSSLPTAQ